MQIIQKKRKHTHIFTFNEEYFNFALNDRNGSDDIDMQYADFPFKSSEVIHRNDWLRNVGFLGCLFGAVEIGFGLLTNKIYLENGIWPILGVICLALYQLSIIKFTVFKNEGARIFIIRDKNHDKILVELTERRKKQLYEWYGAINPENDIENEIAKFKWLLEHDIITREEADKKIAQIELYQENSVEEQQKLLN